MFTTKFFQQSTDFRDTLEKQKIEGLRHLVFKEYGEKAREFRINYEENLKLLESRNNKAQLPIFAWVTMDVLENFDNFIITLSLPGLIDEDVEIVLHENILTVSGEIRQENVDDESKQLLQEHLHGKFSRSFALEGEVDAEQTQANFENGILTINIPKIEATKPHKISITR